MRFLLLYFIFSLPVVYRVFFFFFKPPIQKLGMWQTQFHKERWLNTSVLSHFCGSVTSTWPVLIPADSKTIIEINARIWEIIEILLRISLPRYIIEAQEYCWDTFLCTICNIVDVDWCLIISKLYYKCYWIIHSIQPYAEVSILFVQMKQLSQEKLFNLCKVTQFYMAHGL